MRLCAPHPTGVRQVNALELLMLVALSGLPGTGKTTIGKALAARHSATYVRVDEIEHALTLAPGIGRDYGPTGYCVAFAIALSNLKLGNLVIADSVNPVPESRRGWRDAAQCAGKPIVEVEIICSDEAEHRHRVESRTADIAGFELPTWQSVKTHEYAPWTEPRVIVDTAVLGLEDVLAEIEQQMAAVAENRPTGL